MPISPENKGRYPKDWKLISLKLIWERANNYCERCHVQNHTTHPLTGKMQTLSVAHLDHVIENMEESNLLVMCNYCHLLHDRQYHKEQRFLNQAKRASNSGFTP